MKIKLTHEFVKNRVIENFNKELNDPNKPIKVIKPEEVYQGEWPPTEFINIVKKRYNRPIAIIGYNGGHDSIQAFFNIDELDCLIDKYLWNRIECDDIFNSIFDLNDGEDESKVIGKVIEGHVNINETEEEEGYWINDYYAYIGNWDHTYVAQLDDNGQLYLPEFGDLEFELDDDVRIKDTPFSREWKLKNLEGETMVL